MTQCFRRRLYQLRRRLAAQLPPRRRAGAGRPDAGRSAAGARRAGRRRRRRPKTRRSSSIWQGGGPEPHRHVRPQAGRARPSSAASSSRSRPTCRASRSASTCRCRPRSWTSWPIVRSASRTPTPATAWARSGCSPATSRRSRVSDNIFPSCGSVVAQACAGRNEPGLPAYVNLPQAPPGHGRGLPGRGVQPVLRRRTIRTTTASQVRNLEAARRRRAWAGSRTAGSLLGELDTIRRDIDHDGT